MALAVGGIAGWAFLLGVGAIVVLAVGRRAAAEGILAPVVVGVGLRLVVMLIAHLSSTSLGDHGLFYLDDQTYSHQASALADDWSAGRVPDPAAVNAVGSYQFGYQIFLAALFALGGSSILLGKVANVVLGTLTVYLVGCLGGRLLGERAKVRAAWVAALAPSMIWWSAPLMKEALATTLLMLGALAMTSAARRGGLAVIAFALAALVVVRPSAAVALAVGTGVALAVASRRAGGRLLSRNLLGFGAALVAAVAVIAFVSSHGDFAAYVNQYHVTIARMFHTYQGGSLTSVPFDALKSLVTPVPWAFDHATRDWDRMLYPGVWVIMCALPLAAAGVWRMRRSPEAMGMLAIAVTSVLVNAASAGYVFRQRSMIEPLILLLALAGSRSWQMAARVASAALVAVAVAASVQSRSAPVGLAVAAAAAALALASRRLPSHGFEEPPDSALIRSFRPPGDIASGGSVNARWA